MKQPKKAAPTVPTNDNAASPAGVESMPHGQATSHLYVPELKKHAPEQVIGARVCGRWMSAQIYTDLPEALPVLPEEIALLRGFMGDLVRRILANDNEPL